MRLDVLLLAFSSTSSVIQRAGSLKYAVRRQLKRRKEYLIREVCSSFTSREKDQFWCEVRQLNRVRKSIAPCVDGVTGAQHIANLFSSRFESLLNKHPPSSRSDLLSSVQASLSSSVYEDISFTGDEVYDAIGQLRSKMSDTTGIFTEHLKFSRSVIALPLPLFFTPIVRHGHMPQLIRDSTLVPIPKNDKVASVSANYRPIALSSMLSKLLERLLLNKYKYASWPPSHWLSLGFCCLGMSVLFVGGLCSSASFGVSNGVRQGSILSPFLFALYLDGLLSELVECGVGCHWGNLFAGCLCYADDIVLLAPCPSALRMMLQ